MGDKKERVRVMAGRTLGRLWGLGWGEMCVSSFLLSSLPLSFGSLRGRERGIDVFFLGGRRSESRDEHALKQFGWIPETLLDALKFSGVD